MYDGLVAIAEDLFGPEMVTGRMRTIEHGLKMFCEKLGGLCWEVAGRKWKKRRTTCESEYVELEKEYDGKWLVVSVHSSSIFTMCLQR